MVDRATYRRYRQHEGQAINIPIPYEPERRKRHRVFGRCRRFLYRLSNPNRKMLLIIFGIAIFFGLIFSLYYGISIRTKRPERTYSDTYSEVSPIPINYCYSKACNDSANFMLKSLDRSIDPCNNFHEFVCGNHMVSKYHLIAREVKKNLLDQMSLVDGLAYLQGFDYIIKLQRYYNSCLKNVLTSIYDLRKKFKEVGIWPMANKRELLYGKKLDWTKIWHMFYQAGLKTDFIVDIQFVTDLSDDLKRMIILNSPDTFKFDMQKKNLLYKIVHESWMRLTKLLGLENVLMDITNMIFFETDLIESSYGPLHKKVSTVANLQSMFPKIKWIDFLNGFLTPHARISAEDRVIYFSPHFEKFYDLMTKRKPANNVIINYFFWQNVLNIGEDFLINNGQKTDVNLKQNSINVQIKERKNICVQQMLDDMYIAMGALYIQSYFKKDNAKMVQRMSEKIRKSLYQNVEKVMWLSEEAKIEILKKISQIDVLIGHPPEFLNTTVLNDYYRELNISSINYFINQWNLQRFQRIKNAQEFAEPVDGRHWTGEFSRVTDTSAIYDTQNIVIVHAAMFNKLFVDVNIPNYMNFGLIGAVIGHEFTHALSDENLRYDDSKHVVNDWWDSISSKILTDKYECLIDRYNNYIYEKYKLRVDGKKTLKENVADITGLKAVHDAYVSLTDNEPEEPHLPGFEDFNAKQMFWIAYGSMYCEEFKSKQLIQDVLETDVHAPEHFRVNGVVSSLAEFANDFNCKPTDPMNPTEKCPIWY